MEDAYDEAEDSEWTKGNSNVLEPVEVVVSGAVGTY